jgi:hypothetical protein
MSTLRANAILDAAGGNTATINGIPLRQGVLDPENLIINGAFDFWQRGTLKTSPGYLADRWTNDLNGGTVIQSQQSFAVGDVLGSNNPRFYINQNVSGQTLSSHFANFSQRIEGVRSYAGQTITVLGWARRGGGSGNMAVEADQNFGTGGSPSATVNAISPTTVTLTESFAPFAAVMNIPSIAGKTIGTNSNDSLDLNFWLSAGSDFNGRTNSLGLQAILVHLWGIHIKLGTHTTDAVNLYKEPELSPEFARCQRYYELVGITATTTGQYNNSLSYAVTKRAKPTLSVLAGSLASGTVLAMPQNGEGQLRQETNSTTLGNALIAADAEL